MISEERIEAFFKGTCSEEERKEISLWLIHPENEEKAQAIFKKHWEQVSDQAPAVAVDKEALLRGIKAKIPTTTQKEKQKLRQAPDRQPLGYPARKKSWRGITIMSCLILVFAIGYFAVPQPEESADIQPITMSKTAPRGYRNTIRLTDGSVITLNSESSITYDDNFGKENRSIYLKGEAFFEVAHDKSRPFIVITEDLKTTALGTSFNINAYSGNNTAVSLATGKVKVEQKDTAATDTTAITQLILTPGEQAIWLNNLEGLIKREYDPNLILSWKNNIIYFEQTPLKKMVSVLEKWYDVKITVVGNKKLLRDTGTGRFENTSLENVLSSLGYSMGFTYQINNKEIKLKLNEE